MTNRIGTLSVGAIPRTLMVSSIAILCSTGVTAQTTTPPVTAARVTDTQVLQALLEELRQLRITLQRANVVMLRARIVADEMREQQARVGSLEAQVAELRRGNDAPVDDAGETQLLELQTSINQASDGASRRQLALDYEALRRSIDWQKQYASQMMEHDRARQIELENELATENAKLVDLRRQLAQVERELEEPPAPSRRSR